MNGVPVGVLVARLQHRLTTLRYMLAGDEATDEWLIAVELEGLAEQIREAL